MAKQSGYLKRKKVEIGVYRQAEKETYIQFMSDMFQIALNDPDVMGKDVLGEARIKCVVEAAGRNFDTFHGALENIPEADYFQESSIPGLEGFSKKNWCPLQTGIPGSRGRSTNRPGENEVIGLLTMEEKRYDVAAVKERLNEYREKERDIDNQIERLVRLVTKMSSVGAQTITDMPRSQGTDGDRIGKLVAEKEELEADIRSDERDQKEEWSKIEAILSKLKHSDERAVIRIRYHDRESWSTVAEVIFGNVEDYLDREGTYIRRVHKIHGSALLNMAKIMEDGEPDTEVPAVM